jgi:hypothetical protein
VPLFAAALRRGPALPDADLAGFAAELPFYDGRAVQRWTTADCALHWITESDDGIERGAIAWFGRPIVWTDDAADGRAPLEPGFFAGDHWDELDGRCAVLRFTGGVLEVYSDPMGAYPLYRAEGRGALWIANSPALAARLAGLPERPTDPAALASIVAGGWSLSGEPPIAGVRRIAPEWLWRFDAAGEQRVRRLLELDPTPRPLDVPAAAAALTAATGALADWPGRDSIVPATGGRDSRAVLAAALAAGATFTSRTGGGDGDPDVEIARQLCERAGVPHTVIGAVPGGNRDDDPARAAAILWRLTGGTATLANGAGFPLAPWGEPRPLWHSGQGGETARRVYGDAGDVDGLMRLFTARRPGRPDLLTADAAALVREELARFLAEAADFAPADIPDVFYLRRRMGTWAGPTHAAVEPIRDVTSPLWSRRVAPHLLTGTPDERRHERFHREIVATLAPQFMDFPFQDGTSWNGRPPRANRARRLTAKVARELRRRRHATTQPDKGDSPICPAEAILEHPLMELLERREVEALLALPAEGLDDWRRQQVWRLASLTLV